MPDKVGIFAVAVALGNRINAVNVAAKNLAHMRAYNGMTHRHTRYRHAMPVRYRFNKTLHPRWLTRYGLAIPAF